jgi:glycosyltransferase involved in cell wall biosynthesis
MIDSPDVNASRPKVSVCVITYNQEKFIGDCLQSIVDQKTDFEFELIVGDDVSKDQTRGVIADFARRYPNVVKPIYQMRNIGAGAHNFRTVHLAARGEYVAHVDGDDVILPGKLQAQADILDTHPEVAFAAHAVRIMGSDHLIGADPHYPERGSVYDLLRLGCYFAHSSVMYRRESGGVEQFAEQVIDYQMHIERAARGAIHLDKRVFGAYRWHASGLSGALSRAPAAERAYEQAFDRALELGLDADAVQAARIDRRMKFAVARCLAGDVGGYRQMVRVDPADWRHATLRHKLLHLTRAFPSVVKLYFASKRLGGAAAPTRHELN